ncbi:MAG: YncE family protein, partial [Flavisolibacter sp.]|nr:YncE family protein [Flavisolibacter sp.]
MSYKFNYQKPNSSVFAIILFLWIVSCTPSRVYQASVSTDSNYIHMHDAATLAADNKDLLMPYNRIIDPAGTVIRFGDPTQENHSLDCAFLPGKNVLAVEDRYGLTFIDVKGSKLLYHLDYEMDAKYKKFISTYSGMEVLQIGDQVHIFWSAADPVSKSSLVFDAVWDGAKAVFADAIPFAAVAPAPMALPNDIAIGQEGNETFLYVVLNGNNQLSKIRLQDKKVIWTTPTGMAPFGVTLTATKAYVTNWAGPVPTDATKETAGIPYAKVYVDPRTGATSTGTVTIIDRQSGQQQKEIQVGLHPNAIITSPDEQFVYVANGNSDNVSVIKTKEDKVVETIPVSLHGTEHTFIGSSPNALAINSKGNILYVANGMDNAVAVVKLGVTASNHGTGTSVIEGFIPTEAYPAGLALTDQTLYVANLEGEGARAATNNAYTPHQQEATISIIPLPDQRTLSKYTARVEKANLLFRTNLSRLTPRSGVAPKPVPERIGEPSVFKHVVYIIKENKTYDQVLGDMPEGNGMKSLCVFGDSITPNQHLLARQFQLLDNYYVSGKSSAEGHSWTDAAIVTDYVEKNVRAWFRSYGHVLYDALIYNKEGFLWNHALDHGKSVRIYGEACTPQLNGRFSWKEINQLYVEGKPLPFTNESTISRVRPIMSPGYPCYEGQTFSDQIRADAFIKELKEYEQQPGDQ